MIINQTKIYEKKAKNLDFLKNERNELDNESESKDKKSKANKKDKKVEKNNIIKSDIKGKKEEKEQKIKNIENNNFNNILLDDNINPDKKYFQILTMIIIIKKN